MTQIDNLSKAIMDSLSEYSEEIARVTKNAVEVVSKEVEAEIKKRVSFNRSNRVNEYVKSFKIKTTDETRFNKTKTWYVANGQHRLTHLLEHGHATRTGGRARAFPHIIYGEQLAQRRLPELVEEGVENARR
ncbi:MAG: hypothetical protein CVU90_15180 [Firmicutes bacterium HGW-Firmicutes-15]|jgi:chorismate mutase|nr:MAG: hypothetical protein CVU90_15180 [Firmicutes bacterium HGW-Firmicutes-15]